MAADHSAGLRCGKVTSRHTVRRVAPSTRADSSRRTSSTAQYPPTTRTTTATLKMTCAMRIAQMDWSRFTRPSSSPSRENVVRSAAPITTVGMTNGTITSARTSARPRKSLRATAHAAGSPAASVSNVDTAACHVVNQTMRHVAESPRTEPGCTRPRPSKPRAMTEPTGDAKKTAKNASGSAAASAPRHPRNAACCSREARGALSAGRPSSTARSSRRAWPRSASDRV